MADITQSQYNTAKQPFRNVKIRVDLLNFDYQTISNFEGNVISGNISKDANSNMRRSCDMSLVVTDSSFNIETEGKIWLDRLLQIYIGVDDIRTGETAWTNEGIFLINQPTYNYDAETRNLTFQGVDLYGMFTGLRNGYLVDTYMIPQGSNVRNVIIAILKINGFEKYVVSECTNVDGNVQETPSELKYDVGSTWSDVLGDLQDILPNYQMYFDKDGVFRYEPIPYKANEPIQMDNDIWKENVISEEVSYDFESVKNSIKVLGRTHKVNNFPSGSSVSGNTISMTIGSISSLEDKVLIGFVPTAEVMGGVKIKVNSLGTQDLVDSNDKPIEKLEKDVYYTSSYQKDKGTWLFLGHAQATGEYKDTNVDSPFYIGNPAGEIKLVLYGDEYDNILSDELATERAKWEIYQRCRLNDSINLTTVPIYWAEVNWMVSYTPLGTTEQKQYLIKSINTDLSPEGTQTFNLVKYYPYYQ